MCLATVSLPLTKVTHPSVPGGACELEPHNVTNPVPHGSPAIGPTTRSVSSVRKKARPFRVISHNIQGTRGSFDLDGETRDYGKLETLAIQLHVWQVDAILVQETWLLDDWTVSSQGCTIIHHGPKIRPSNQGGGGGAIILGPRAIAAWKNAGSPEPYRPGNIAGLPTTR